MVSRVIVSTYIIAFLCWPAWGQRALRSNGELRLQNSEYISSGQTYFREGAEGRSNSIALGIDSDWDWRKFGAALRLSNEYSGSERWNYLKIFDAHVDWSPRRTTSLALGRKFERWTEWEEEWRQGVFQSRYMQNKLRPEGAGLVGVFLAQGNEDLKITLGLLPAFVPDLGAHFSVQDDKFVSRNPWFNPPAAHFIFREEMGEIRYSLEKPAMEEVVNNPGGVAKFEFTGNKNYRARFAAAYKPMPQLLLGFPSRNRVFVTANDNYMSVRITPRWLYHTLLSHDSMLKMGGWTATGSLVREIPDEDKVPESFTSQRSSPAWITALGLSHPLEEDGPYAARLKMGFFKVQGGDERDQGDFAGERSLFEHRYQYKEAYSLGLNKPWRGFGLFPLDTEMHIIYDRLQNGGVLGLSAGMNFTREWRADLELDFLGLMAGGAEVEDGFLALYRANDRVGLGISYVY